MSTDAFPYLTRLDVLHASGEVIDVPALVAANTHPWYNQTLCRVNESVVRLGVVQGEYHWHKHDAEDEFFYVVSGNRSDRRHAMMRRIRTMIGSSW